MRRPSLFGWLGGTAVAAIVVASILVRSSAPADPLADVGAQRSEVAAFHELVREGRWDEVFRATSEPPARSPSAFGELMRRQVAEHGAVASVRIDSLRLLRSRTVPLLEVHETVTLSKDGRRKASRTVSYFARRDDRWLFAFSAPGDRD